MRFKKIPEPPIHFPKAWPWFVDEFLPHWVKKNYSPKESWKKQPFSKKDVEFFSRGIEELSALFTESRPERVPPYFRHEKFRSSYLLYFLPLQAAKWVAVFEKHPQAWLKITSQLRFRQQTLKIVDLGAGPGTASLSLLLWLMDQRTTFFEAGVLPQIELFWWDTNPAILKDGQAILESLCDHFSALRGKVQLQTFTAPWWEATEKIQGPVQFTLMSNVLNESKSVRDIQALERLLEKNDCAGLILIEPAFKKAAQLLSLIRDTLNDEKESLLWGPCLHQGDCPLREGRDWCHFSMPVDIPGTWFKEFSKQLGSERQWVKFSYLWFASPELQPTPFSPSLRRVISDPLDDAKSKRKTTLLCEPQEALRVSSPKKPSLHRGDLIEMQPDERDPAGPLSGTSGSRQA